VSVTPAAVEEVQPPPLTVGPLGWLRANLFSSWINSVLTIALVAILAWAVLGIAQWVLTEARWGVITQNLRLFLIGIYPADEAWRPWLCLALVSVLTGLSSGTWGSAARVLANWTAGGQLALAALAAVSSLGVPAVAALVTSALSAPVSAAIAVRRPVPRRWLVLGWLASVPVVVLVLLGLPGAAELPYVPTSEWGGLLLTLLLAVVSIALSFPLGVLLALGRRSRLPALRLLSTVFIEVVRGVPLVSVIFLVDIMLPLFLPEGFRLDRVVRAIGGFTLFTAAYVAENVRGGLQAIPRGQIEAAHAIGLSTVQTNLFVVLPQALRAVIPANVGAFISLLKDTTLVVIVGLLDLLGIGRAVLAQSEWVGTSYEVYGFVAVVFFVLCYTMSKASYRLEAALGVGTR
jgi:general L-amino acid transport system permease protein